MNGITITTTRFLICYCSTSRKKVEFSVGGESFHCTGQHVITKGFTAIMPWLAINDKSIPSFTKGQKIKVSKVELYEVSVDLLPQIQFL